MKIINHDIDVRYEDDLLKAFDKFIEKWCGVSYPHLIDSDENDGEFMRDKIREALGLINSQEEKEDCPNNFAKTARLKIKIQNYWHSLDFLVNKDIKKSSLFTLIEDIGVENVEVKENEEAPKLVGHYKGVPFYSHPSIPDNEVHAYNTNNFKVKPTKPKKIEPLEQEWSDNKPCGSGYDAPGRYELMDKINELIDAHNNAI